MARLVLALLSLSLLACTITGASVYTPPTTQTAPVRPMRYVASATVTVTTVPVTVTSVTPAPTAWECTVDTGRQDKPGALNVRETPGGAIIGILEDGQKVTILSQVDGWYKINGGWIAKEFCK